MKVPKRIVNQKAQRFAAYHKGPILTNGALEFVYDRPLLSWPMYTLLGGGVAVLGQFNPYQGPQSEYNLSLTVAPIYGAGVPASPIELQNLVAGAPGGSGGES